MLKFRLTPLAAAALVVYAVPTFAQEASETPATNERAVALPSVKVQDSAETTYKPEKASSPKFTQPLVDTPQTITVIKKEIIADQGSLSLADALRNTPGITFQAGENGNSTSGDAIFMRGFDAQGSIFIDNVRDLGPASRDVFNIEQIEIAKGPSGADNGRGSASGYVNLASKLPFASNAYSGSVAYGTEDRSRATADLNQLVGEKTAIRLNLVGQDGGVAGRDKVERELWGIAPSIAFGLGTDTRTYIFTQHMRQNNLPDGGVSAIGISGYRNLILEGRDANGNPTNSTGTPVDARPVDTKNFYGLDTDFEDIKSNMFTVKIEHDLAPGTTVRNLSRYGKVSQEREMTAPLQAPVVASPNTAGPNAVVQDPATWTQGRSRQGISRENEVLTNQSSFVTTVKTGVIQHDISTGFEFIYESQYTPTLTAASGQVAANLYNPDSSQPGTAITPNGAYTDGNTTTGALYLFDTLKFGEQWQLNGGLRWERFETETNSVSLSTATAQPTLPVGTLVPGHGRLADNLLSYKTGLVFKPLPSGSVYISTANNKRPPATDGFVLNTTSATNINNPGLKPQTSKNLEVGTKWEFFGGKLLTTAALFQSENKNDVARNEADQTVTQYGKREVEGVELSAIGQITPNWQLSFGYTYQDAKVKEGAWQFNADGTPVIGPDGNPMSTQTGAAINFSPKQNATLWTTYKLPIPLTVGGGLRYVDTQTRTVNNNLANVTTGIVKVDDYVVFDAMAKYDITPNYGLQLNVYNIADEDYVASVNNSGQRYFPGTPRSYLLTLNLSF